MTRVLLAAATAAVFCGCEPEVSLPRGEMQPGGVTFDFKTLGDRRFASGVEGPNLLAPEWAGPFKSEKAEWSKTLFWFDEGSMGGRYRITFRYKMRHSSLPIGGSGGTAMIYRQSWSEKQIASGKKGRPSKTTGGLVYINLQNSASEWNLATTDFSFNPDHAGAYLRVSLQGEGMIEFKDVEIRRISDANEPEVRITAEPSSSLDGTFAVPQGQCGLVSCVWSKRDKEKRYHAGRIEVRTSVTGDFEILESPKRCGTPWAARNNFWNTLGTVVKATGGVGSEGTLRFEVFYEGKSVSNVETLRLFTVPAIHAQAPERYTAGFSVGGTYMTLADPAARAKYMSDCVDWGVRTVTPASDNAADWRRAGVTKVINGGVAANGYRIAGYCRPEDRPADERFVSLASLNLKDYPGRAKYEREFAKYSCPISVYEEKPFFKNVVVPYMREQLKGFDGSWANWEPYATDGQGCFCTNCAKAFARYLKVPEGEVLRDWPLCVLRNSATKGRYADQEPRFRSLEHAKLVRTLDKYVTKFTGGEKSMGFMPGVGFDQVTSIWKEYEIASYYQPHDYMGALKWLEPWGPYTHWKSHEPYIPYKGDILRCWCAAKDIRETVDREFPPERRPKLQSYPQGAQGDGWIVQPEWLEIMMDAFFFNRWESTSIYYFPRGYDARWWKAFANHATRAAKYEKYVWDGVRCDASVALEPNEEFARPASYVGGRFPQFGNVSMLQHAAYDLGGSRMVAALNHWHAAEAYFRMSAKGLPDGKYAIVDEEGTLWRPDGRRVLWSARALADGAELYIPAMRTRVFEIVPAAELERRLADRRIAAQLSAEDVRARHAERLGHLRAAKAADDVYERDNACAPRKLQKGEVYR